MKLSIPRIVIGGTSSGCGKTTVSAGIMEALVKRGLKLQPFKVGPDYIDPMFHKAITGRYSRNLDSWLLSEDTVFDLFCKNAWEADIAIIEGMMGLFDGFNGSSLQGSTAHISEIIEAPIILVVDCNGMALSIAAIIKGFLEFRKSLDIRGVIINNIHNQGHYKLIKDIIEKNTEVKVIGYLPYMREFTLPERHLGLVLSEEIPELHEKMEFLSTRLSETIDLDLLLEIASNNKRLGKTSVCESERKAADKKHIRLGVAYDKAFNFYYKDNFDLLENYGAELCFFSPINDKSLPENVSGLYIGGGYPEVWAEELEANTCMKQAINSAIAGGMPVYAECGGFMYLTESLETNSGRIYNMVGAIPGKSKMTQALKRFGYVTVQATDNNIMFQKGDTIRAHEFHFSEAEIDKAVNSSYMVERSINGSKEYWNCGFRLKNLLAAYPHIHFWAKPELAENFLKNCIFYQKEKHIVK